MTTATTAAFQFDPFSAAVIADPDGWYRRLRDEDPVHYNRDYDTFFVSRFEDVWNTLRIGDNTLLATETNLPTAEWLRTRHNPEAPPFASTDPVAFGPTLPSPTYEQMRQAHIAPLRPRAVRELTDTIRALARSQLDQVLQRKTFDFFSDYAAIVPARVICSLFGLPPDTADAVMGRVNAVGRFQAERQGVDLREFFSALSATIGPAVTARRAAGANGAVPLIDGLLNLDYGVSARRLTDEEVVNQLVCAMVGGLESVPKVSCGGLLSLWQDPAQLAAVRTDLAGRLPVAIEEMLRYCAPAQYTFRTVHKPLSIVGRAIRPGQRVACLLYSASRDEREFADPDRFIWDRQIPRVLSFGAGQHHCIGKHLALLEVQILLREFFDRVEEFSCDVVDADRNPGYFQRGWVRLPVRVVRPATTH